MFTIEMTVAGKSDYVNDKVSERKNVFCQRPLYILPCFFKYIYSSNNKQLLFSNTIKYLNENAKKLPSQIWIWQASVSPGFSCLAQPSGFAFPLRCRQITWRRRFPSPHEAEH